ncbi:MAG: MFS transporter [Saprospirales bacterium]|nr:MAG: MFS transporter [Saprospirales bacterium]
MEEKDVFPKNVKKVLNAWAFFDWANSSYALVITVAIFPVYFLATTDDILYLFGYGISNSALYAFAITLSYLTISILAPMLSGIADVSSRRKFFMKLFTWMGGLACIGMFFFTGDVDWSWKVGIGGFIISMVGFAGGIVFYNSYLPIIATEDKFDRLSAHGFALGYYGSVILLVFLLVIITFHESFGLEYEVAVRLSFLLVGVWWIGFAQITFRAMPRDLNLPVNRSSIVKGYKELYKVWKSIRHKKGTRGFLMAFFFYSAGVQTVLFLASAFAESELNFGETELIIIVIILQLLAAAGAYFFARVSFYRGNIWSITLMLMVWTSICLFAYFIVEKYQFYILASMVGLVMGGIQSLSRSTYSKLMPKDTKDVSSYFSFYESTEKIAIVIGTFSFGFIDQLTGGMRNSVLALAIFFIAGLLILYFTPFGKRVQTQSPDSTEDQE